MVFHQYLKLYVFVWARVFCGIRYYQSAPMDRSGVIQKIHIRKIRLDQDLVNIRDYQSAALLRGARP